MYEMNIFLIQMIYICGYYPTLSVTGNHTDFISMYVFYMKNKYESRITIFFLFIDVSDDIQIGRP
jgi:hypothetical protein